MKKLNMLTVPLVILAFALAPGGEAQPRPDGGPVQLSSNEAPRPDGGPTRLAADDRGNANSEARSASSTGPDSEQSPIVTIHSTDNVKRGKTGSFVLNMNSLMLGGTYVKFFVSGTAVPGVDYVPPVSPVYVGPSGYGVILIQTLPDPRGSSIRRSYDMVVTLEPGAGYALGVPSSAQMWIKP